MYSESFQAIFRERLKSTSPGSESINSSPQRSTTVDGNSVSAIASPEHVNSRRSSVSAYNDDDTSSFPVMTSPPRVDKDFRAKFKADVGVLRQESSMSNFESLNMENLRTPLIQPTHSGFDAAGSPHDNIDCTRPVGSGGPCRVWGYPSNTSSHESELLPLSKCFENKLTPFVNVSGDISQDDDASLNRERIESLEKWADKAANLMACNNVIGSELREECPEIDSRSSAITDEYVSFLLHRSLWRGHDDLHQVTGRASTTKWSDRCDGFEFSTTTQNIPVWYTDDHRGHCSTSFPVTTPLSHSTQSRYVSVPTYSYVVFGLNFSCTFPDPWSTITVLPKITLMNQA